MATMNYVTTLEFDFGAIDLLAEKLKTFGIERPLICTDPGIVAAGIIDRVRGVLPNTVSASIFDRTPENPTEEAVDLAARQYRAAGCDGIVAVGGGSSMDLGKAVALAVTHDGPVSDYTVDRGGRDRIGAVAPLIAIPTTSGTGSEVSRAAVIIMRDGRKLILGHPNLAPRVSLCDPELTLGLPPRLTAASGMDAVTHCVEAVLSPAVNPPAEAIGLDGIYRAIGQGHLQRAFADGNDRDARWNMMMASSEGAMAFVKGLGAVHSMSHACGAITSLNLHHGTLNAVCLPAVLRYNADHVGDRLDRVAHAMCLADAAEVPGFIESLNQQLGLPSNLREMGVEDAMLPELIGHAALDVCNATNPRPVGEREYDELFALLMA
jgi:alcohol dehydrogenase class IV